MRAQRPFDTRAMASADDAFYRAHPELAPGGKRVPLAEGDPRTDEWLCLYQAYGGKLAADPPGQKPVGGAKQLCQKVKARLRVELSYLRLPAPVAGATVTLAGPESRTGKSDARGVVEFADLAPGDYQVQAVLNSGNAMVDAARPMAGSSTCMPMPPGTWASCPTRKTPWPPSPWHPETARPRRSTCNDRRFRNRPTPTWWWKTTGAGVPARARCSGATRHECAGPFPSA